MVSYVHVASIHVRGRANVSTTFINYEARVGLVDVKQWPKVELSVNEVCATMPTDMACIAGNLFVFHCGNLPILGRFVTINQLVTEINDNRDYVWYLSEVQVYENLALNAEECNSGRIAIIITLIKQIFWVECRTLNN